MKDRVTKEPAKLETAEVLEGCKKRDVLIGKGDLHGNVLRIKPPMCITRMTPITWPTCWIRC